MTAQRSARPSAGPAPSGLADGRYVALSLDVGRKAFSVESVERLLARMGELGFTALKLHLTETRRVGVQLPGFEHLAADDAWAAADCDRIVAAAHRAGIGLVPEVDLPSHAGALLRGREHLRLVDDEGVLHDDKLDVTRPEALAFATALLEAAHVLFPGDAIHVGGDEYFAAPWEPEAHRSPDRFPGLVAHARAQWGPAATALDSYAAFMNALAARARELGRQVLIWNDHVVPASEHPCVPIDHDVVVDVWIRWREWTPSVTDYLASGYDVVNSHGDLLYFVLSHDGVPEPHGRRRFGLMEDLFRPRRFMGLAAQDRHIDVPTVPPSEHDPVRGASMSVWCDAPDALPERETLALLDTWLVPFARVMGRADMQVRPARA